MAEQEVVYKPVLDTSDFANQLMELQQQLNAVLSSTSMSSVGGASFAGTAGSMAIQDYSNITGVPNFSATTAATVASNFVQQQSEALKYGFGALAQSLPSSANVSNLMPAMPGQGIAPSPLGLQIDTISKPNFGEDGLIKSFFRSRGFGFDPNTAGMTFADYQDEASRRLGSAALFGDIMDTVGGAADITSLALWGGSKLGLVGAGVGSIAGTVALPLTAAVGLASWGHQTNVERERMARFIEQDSYRFDGTINANVAAGQIQRMFNSADFGKLGISQFQGEQLISDFSNAGGFDTVRSTEEYVQRARELMSSSQKVAQLLHTHLQEAASVIAQLETAGITRTPLETENLIRSAEARAGMAGMTTTQYLGVGMAGANVALSMGITPEAGMQGGLAAAAALEQAVRSGYLSNNALLQLGGQEAAAKTLMEGTAQWATSPLGMAYQAATLGGASRTGDPMSIIAQGAGAVGSPQDILYLIGNQSKWASEVGMDQLMVMRAAAAVQMANTVMPGAAGLDQNSLAALLKQMNLAGSIPEAQALLGTLTVDYDKLSSEENTRMVENYLGDIASENTIGGRWRRFKGQLNESLWGPRSTIGGWTQALQRGLADNSKWDPSYFSRAEEEEGAAYFSDNAVVEARERKAIELSQAEQESYIAKKSNTNKSLARLGIYAVGGLATGLLTIGTLGLGTGLGIAATAAALGTLGTVGTVAADRTFVGDYSNNASTEDILRSQKDILSDRLGVSENEMKNFADATGQKDVGDMLRYGAASPANLERMSIGLREAGYSKGDVEEFRGMFAGKKRDAVIDYIKNESVLARTDRLKIGARLIEGTFNRTASEAELESLERSNDPIAKSTAAFIRMHQENANAFATGQIDERTFNEHFIAYSQGMVTQAKQFKVTAPEGSELRVQQELVNRIYEDSGLNRLLRGPGKDGSYLESVIFEEQRKVSDELVNRGLGEIVSKYNAIMTLVRADPDLQGIIRKLASNSTFDQKNDPPPYVRAQN